MNERIRITDKKPEAKSQNLVPHIRRKIDSFQLMSSSVDRILFLQRTIGNQAVARLMKSGVLQAKLRIGQPGDIYEQEADRVAEQVMRMPEPAAGLARATAPQVQGQCPKYQDELKRQPPEEDDERVQTKPIVPGSLLQKLTPEEEHRLHAQSESTSITIASLSVENAIHALPVRGQSLPESVRSFMEPRFNTEFSAVRIHTDSHAHDLARSVNSQAFTAFTVGRDIAFGDGQYAPETGRGKHLITHELTHVVQQGGEKLRRARTPTKEGAATGGAQLGRERGALNFLSTAQVALDPSNSLVHRQPIIKTPADVNTTAGEVEDLVDFKEDRKGALEKLNPLDMRDLLTVVAKLRTDALAKSSAAYADLHWLLQTAPNKPTESVNASRLLAAFDASPTSKLRNPEPGVAPTNPTVSGYRKRPDTSSAVARPGDWGEDPAGNTWIAHPEGIRTYWRTNVAKDKRSSAWLADNPGNADYKKAITKRAIGSFRWGHGVHDFAVYFSETDATADLQERVATFSKSTMTDYIRVHDATRPGEYLKNMQQAVPELKGSDTTTLWTGDDQKWTRLIEGFKSAEGWIVGTTVTKANVATISTDSKDTTLVDYYRTLVGAP